MLQSLQLRFKTQGDKLGIKTTTQELFIVRCIVTCISTSKRTGTIHGMFNIILYIL